MDSTYNGSELLLQRFPDLSFLLMVEQVDPLLLTQDEKGYFHATGKRGPLYNEDVEEEIKQWQASFSLNGVDSLYVYGIGLGYYYEALEGWLQEKKERALIFFEDDLSVLHTLFSLPLGDRILQNSQVHLCYVPHPSAWAHALDEQVIRFISDRVEFTCLLSYQSGQEKKIKKLRLELLRKATLVHVGMGELLHYHVLMENIASNFQKLPESFHMNKWKDAFKDVPAVICGAGSSLKEAIAFLSEVEQKALIFAGGSTITALSHKGIRPHIAMALDPNDEEYVRLKGSSSFEVPFVYSARLHEEVLSSSNVKGGYLCSDTGGTFESWLHEALSIEPDSLGPELGIEALSVTTLAVPLARHLGCNPIIFCGVDLSYQNKQRYAPGVLASSQIFLEELLKETRAMEKILKRKNQEGKWVSTLVKWVMEASCIGSYAKKNKKTSFFNASLQGLCIPHVPYLSLEEFIRQYCQKEYDLRGRLQIESELTSFSVLSKEHIERAFKDLATSLKVCFPLFESMLQEIERYLPLVSDGSLSVESGLMTVLEMDLQEEAAYKACLESAFLAYQRILERHYQVIESLETEKGRKNFLEKKRHLWKECFSIARQCLRLLEKKM